jgi:hypothetical protein
MGFFSKFLSSLQGKAPTGSDRYLPIYVLSNRCHEPIVGQIDLMNEVSLDDEAKSGYFTRKVLHTSGKDRCFGQVEVEVWLDEKKRIVRYAVKGGQWLTPDEYRMELDRRADEEFNQIEQENASADQSEQTE